MAAVTKKCVQYNQFIISFPIMSCYFLKMTKILQFGLEYSRYSSSELLQL